MQNKHGKLKGNQENMCNTHESNGVSAKNQQYISSGNSSAKMFNYQNGMILGKEAWASISQVRERKYFQNNIVPLLHKPQKENLTWNKLRPAKDESPLLHDGGAPVSYSAKKNLLSLTTINLDGGLSKNWLHRRMDHHNSVAGLIPHDPHNAKGPPVGSKLDR